MRVTLLRARRGQRPTQLAAITLGIVVAAIAPSEARAQECRRMCLVGEVRDGNGCCGPAPTPAPTVRCPAGTTWNESQRACIGRRVCPSGSHPEGSRCVADAVACPAGTERRDGQCVSQITCPAGSRLDNGRCVSDVTCPAGTTFTSGACVSQDVTCPAGTTRRPEGGCVATPTCPANTQFVEGRGCLMPITCPALTHLDGERCVPDHVCVEGEQFVDGRCQSVCASIAHSRWDGERRSCVCDEGFRAQAGQCAAAQTERCADGTHMDGGRCVADVVCPEGYAFQQGRGCVDPALEARVLAGRDAMAAEERARREQLAREENERRITRWGRGPGVQFMGGGGYQFIYMPNAYQAVLQDRVGSGQDVRYTGAAVWNGPVVSGGLTAIVNDFSLALVYSWAPGSTWATPSPSGTPAAATPTCPDPSQTRATAIVRADGGWCTTTSDMHLLMFDIAQQGVSERHAWRVGLGVGWEFAGNAIATQIGYRSTIKLVAGLFVAIEARVLAMVRLFPGGDPQRAEFRDREVLQTPMGFARNPAAAMNPMAMADPVVEPGRPPFGIGGAALVHIGYSIH